MKWKSWRSAPKDGRVILAWWNAEYIETVKYSDGEWIWSHDGDSWGANSSGPRYWADKPADPIESEAA